MPSVAQIVGSHEQCITADVEGSCQDAIMYHRKCGRELSGSNNVSQQMWKGAVRMQ
jgi:hypothetical protein